MLRGELEREIKEEPRANLCLTTKPNDVLLMDIDNWEVDLAEIPGFKDAVAKDKAELKDDGDIINKLVDTSQTKIGQHQLVAMAEHVLGHFPEVFKEVSYFLHASSSMGLNGKNRISLHIEFVLNAPLAPKLLKDWLLSMNFLIDAFKSKLSLNATGLGLRFPLDRSVADNSKLIFIGHPYFELSKQNPILNEHRLLLIEKKALLMPSEALSIPLRQTLIDMQNSAVADLRKKMGLAKKSRADVRRVTRFGETLELLKNPDKVHVEIVDDDGDFVHANMGDGDSHAYWWPKSDPTLIYNFKGDPVVRLQDIDPETYEWCLKHHAEFINSQKKVMYLGRRVIEDGVSSGFITAAINTETQLIYEMVRHNDKASAEDWMASVGEFLGENVSMIRVEYNPKEELKYRIDQTQDGRPVEYLNLFCESELWRKREMIDDKITYDNLAKKLKEHVPNSYTLLKHVFGGKDIEVAHFINWLSWLTKSREKPGTTWLLHGTQGTGKGILWEHLLTPLMGKENVRKTTIVEMEDKFNAGLAKKMLVLVDEFRHSEASASKRLESQLRLMATEGDSSVRAMRTEYADKESYFGMIFFSNEYDAMRVPGNDRRINVATRQETRLRDALATNKDPSGIKEIQKLIKGINGEIQMFANLLYTMETDEVQAKLTLDTEAKQAMAVASRTRTEDFAFAIKNWDISMLISYALNSNPNHLNDTRQMLEGLRNIAQFGVGTHVMEIPRDVVLAFYRAATGDDKISAAGLTKYLARHTSPTHCVQTRTRRDGKQCAVYRTNITLTPQDIKELLEFLEEKVA